MEIMRSPFASHSRVNENESINLHTQNHYNSTKPTSQPPFLSIEKGNPHVQNYRFSPSSTPPPRHPSLPSFPLRHTHVMSRSPCHSPSAVVASTTPTPHVQGCSLIHLSCPSNTRSGGKEVGLSSNSPPRKYVSALRTFAMEAEKCCCVALRCVAYVRRC
jgi:hypothetical protein